MRHDTVGCYAYQRIKVSYLQRSAYTKCMSFQRDEDDEDDDDTHSQNTWFVLYVYRLHTHGLEYMRCGSTCATALIYASLAAYTNLSETPRVTKQAGLHAFHQRERTRQRAPLCQSSQCNAIISAPNLCSS